MIPGCTLTFTRSYANIHVGTGAAPTTESNPHFLHPHARRYADANDRGIGVATSEGLVVTVTFLSEQPEQGTWVATAFPVPNVTVTGTTANFSGTTLTNTSNQSTMTLTGTLGFQ